MTYVADPRVDAYIDALPDWQLHAADPEVEETVKRRVRPSFVLQGDVINAKALKPMLQQIIANNRAGGWRKLKQES